jgi:cationic peptide transport system permease protein
MRFLRPLFKAAGLVFGIAMVAFVYKHLSTPGPEQDMGHLLRSFVTFAQQLLQGHFGTTRDGAPVLDLFVQRLPATMLLMILAIAAAWLFGLPLALYLGKQSANKGHWLRDMLAGISVAIPVFWMGQLLISLFATGLGWLPVGGDLDWVYDIPNTTGVPLVDAWFAPGRQSTEAFVNALEHIILPLAALTLAPTAYVAQELNAQLENTLRQPFVLAARARGIPESRVLLGHALPNALYPVLSGMPVQFSLLVSSVVVVETLFLWPGIGSWLVALVRSQDMGALPGALVLFGLLIAMLNMLSDAWREWWMPRRSI